MAFVIPTVRRRVLITGETGSGKTHSLRSVPSPKIVLVYPGEHGHDSLVKPDGSPLDPDTQVLVWQQEEKKGSTQIIEEVRKETLAALKTPGLQSFCGDGLHKLYEYVMDALSGGNYFKGAQFKTESRDDSLVVDPRVANQAMHWMSDYLTAVNASAVPYVFFTLWDKDRGIRKAKSIGFNADGTPRKEKWQDIPNHKMPALYSEASRNILGLFGVCVHASLVWEKNPLLKDGQPVPGKFTKRRVYRWQTQPDEEVGACAVKGDAAVTAKIPKYVPADWRELEKYL